MKLRIVTFEGRSKVPVIEHVFHGTRKQIMDIIVAHAGTDRFFRAAITGGGGGGTSVGDFEGIPLRSEWHWS
jgi:hypothetical protein